MAAENACLSRGVSPAVTSLCVPPGDACLCLARRNALTIENSPKPRQTTSRTKSIKTDSLASRRRFDKPHHVLSQRVRSLSRCASFLCAQHTSVLCRTDLHRLTPTTSISCGRTGYLMLLSLKGLRAHVAGAECTAVLPGMHRCASIHSRLERAQGGRRRSHRMLSTLCGASNDVSACAQAGCRLISSVSARTSIKMK